MGRLDGEVVLIDVQRFQQLGREIARRTGVPHESPQAIVLVNGRVAWHADHRGVTAEALGAALRSLGRDTGE